MTTKKEFRINEFLTVKLENGNTNIYVSGKLFDQCKFLMLNIPVENIEDFDDIHSIDEAAERLNWTEDGQRGVDYNIPPETEFLGHCSNLQAWWEHGYDTRLLHRNLAFPLLKRLVDEGDINAQEVFQKEIVKRIESGHPSVIEFLFAEDYLEYLDLEKFQPSPRFEEILIDLMKTNKLELAFKFKIIEIENYLIFKKALCDPDSDLLSHIINYLYQVRYNEREHIKRESNVFRLFYQVKRAAAHLVAEAIIRNYNNEYAMKELMESRLFEIFEKDDLEFLIRSETIDFIKDFITFFGNNFNSYKQWAVLFDWSYYKFPDMFYVNIRERAPHILESKIIDQLRNGDEEELDDIHYFNFIKFVSFKKIFSFLQSNDNLFVNRLLELAEKSNYTNFEYYIDFGKLFDESLKEYLIKQIEQQDLRENDLLIKKMYLLGWIDPKDFSIRAILEQKSFEEIKQDEDLLRTLVTSNHNELNKLERDGVIDISKKIVTELLIEENYSKVKEFKLLNALSSMFSNPNTSDSNLVELLKNEIFKRMYIKDLNKLSQLFSPSNKFIDHLTIDDLHGLFSNDDLNFVNLLISLLEHRSGRSGTFYHVLKTLVRCGDITSISFCEENFDQMLKIPKSEIDYLRKANILNQPFNTIDLQKDLLGNFKEKFLALAPDHVDLLKLKLELLDSYIPLFLNYISPNYYYDDDDERFYGFYADIICNIGKTGLIKEEIYKITEQSNLNSKSDHNFYLLAYKRIFSKKEFWDDFVENVDYNTIRELEETYDVDLDIDSYDYYYDEEQKVSIRFRIDKKKLTGLFFFTEYGIPFLIPEPITRLKELKFLKIHGFGLNHWPNWIQNFRELEYLNLSRNKIKVIPESIKKLTSLKVLNLHENRLISLPESIGDLELLEELILDSNRENQIKILPESIGSLKSLKKLDLRGNLLEILPESIGNLKSLQDLDLSSNRMIYLPDSIKNLRNLKVLNLAYNSKEIKLDSISGLRQLEDLNLNQNYLGSIPVVLNELPNLKKLDLTTNKLSEISNLDNLRKLEVLKLANNQIEEISGLSTLKELKDLILDLNRITEIKGLSQLKNLDYLNLGMNQITELKGLDELDNLKGLLLSHNQIPDIKGLENLTKLVTLSLERNQISEIKGLENIHDLHSLRIKDNPIPSSLIKSLGGESSRSYNGVYSPRKFVEYCRNKIITAGKTSQHHVEVNDKKFYLWNDTLDLQGLDITSFSEIKGIKKLIDLKALILNRNKISDIRDLQVLKNLRRLDLSSNNITEIEGLESMKDLEVLNLSHNKIIEIKGLDTLKKLKFLDLKANILSEIKGLEQLENLEHLDLGSNEITELKGFENLKKLKHLSIGYNPIPKQVFDQLNQSYPYDNYVKDPQEYVEYCKLKKNKLV